MHNKILIALAFLASPVAAATTDIVMYRDPGCTCCEAWAAQVAKAFSRPVKIIDDGDRRRLLGTTATPTGLASCHTALIAGMAFEGHVPIADMKRVLAERPKGVRSLAVPGMPIGSTGMEVPGRAADKYTVIAYGEGRPKIYANH